MRPQNGKPGVEKCLAALPAAAAELLQADDLTAKVAALTAKAVRRGCCLPDQDKLIRLGLGGGFRIVAAGGLAAGGCWFGERTVAACLASQVR